MSLNVGDQEYNGGKKYRQKGTLCGPNTNSLQLFNFFNFWRYTRAVYCASSVCTWDL
jgi:hypothetical protein